MKRWKIKRELDRLWQQIISIPAVFIEYFQQKKYDSEFTEKVKILDGADLETDLYAVVLSYQVRGLSKASLYTVQHLRSKGYRVLLVSNVALSEGDLAELTCVAWKIMVRPNFGYDFGGYRDGLRWLKQHNYVPKRLLLLNDSVWYPLYTDDRLLARIDQSTADFIGALELQKKGRGGKYIFESYFYSFTAKLYQNSVFTQFWENYLLSNIKYRAITAGEKKLSKLLLHSEKNHEGIFNSRNFLSLINQQDHLFLYKTLVYAAYADDSLAEHNQKLRASFNQSDEWRNSALKHISAVVGRSHFHASFCFATIQLLGIPFLKKSFTPLHIAMRRQYCAAVLNGDLPPPSSPAMFEEIVSRDQ